ncbi:hypothetical protein DBR32_00790 [Taibaiella sp. KBW10]|uniref:hypothetical protein n=1 Tax=Taibaiella sp. KBW10 TaxID=2153357 RepID=UPI000F597923|nr:hypothetical protein [Taibaiella sp. KBW10]RQO32184.1 hypothetical protein DBR32_00790 [Taibaiella sp. KBW10]
MKNYLSLLLCVSMLLLISCSGSDVYQGNWKATDMSGNKFEINFAPKQFTIKETNGKIATYAYTQNKIKIQNSVKSYGITLADGRMFTITFPLAKEAGKAIITLDNKQPLYIISRNAYITYKDFYSLTGQP